MSCAVVMPHSYDAANIKCQLCLQLSQAIGTTEELTRARARTGVRWLTDGAAERAHCKPGVYACDPSSIGTIHRTWPTQRKRR